MKKNIRFALLATALAFPTTMIEAKTVKGIVTDEQGNPLSGVVIEVPSELGYFTTNTEGIFDLNINNDVRILTLRYRGYKDTKVKVSEDGNVKIVMKSDQSLSDEMIDVALNRKERRETYTGAVSTVKSDVISRTPSIGSDVTLEGHLAGVTQMQNSGVAPDDGTAYYIRGFNSYTGNAILVVLDGVPSPTLSINSLDPGSIESITILKDAAAKALYGPVGAQGVILVNTKKGISGKNQINGNANFSLTSPTYQLSTRDSYSYATLRNQALIANGLPKAFNDNELQSYQDGTGTDNRWTDILLNHPVVVQNYNANIKGGNNRVQFFVHGGYIHQGSIYKTNFDSDKYDPTNSYQRFSLVSNVDVNVFKFLKAFISTNLRYSNNNQSAESVSSIYNEIIRQPATLIGPTTSDGKVLTNEYFGNPAFGQINRTGQYTYRTTNINANFGLDLDMSFITQGLSTRGLIGYQSNYYDVFKKNRTYARYTYDNTGNLVIMGSSIDSPISIAKYTSTFYFMNIQAFIDYKRTFGIHSVEATAGYLAEDRISDGTSRNWSLPMNRISWNLHAKYGLLDRYFIQYDFNHSGSEQLKKGNRFHSSNTISGAWVISKELFMQKVNWLNMLKLRSSYGNLTYDNFYSIGRFLYLDDIRNEQGAGVINSLYTAALIKEYQRGNANLHWERSKQLNIGVDFTLFNALSVSLDYWNNQQTDMIVRSEIVPELLGVSNSYLPYQNIGKMNNKGIDLNINYLIKKGKNLIINFNANLGYNRNKVQNIDELDLSADNYAYPYRRTGFCRGQSFGYEIDYSNGNGFFNSKSEIINSGLTYSGTAPRVGDFIYKDQNGDKVIDERDYVPLASTKAVPSVAYGFGTDVTYKDFDLHIFFQGIGDYARVYSGLGIYENQSQGVYNTHHEHAWTAERYAAGESITYPTLTTTTSSNLVSNSFFTSRSDFFRLKNLTFGYSLPHSLVKKLHLEKIRVYFSGENLFTTTKLKFKNIDPETGTVGLPINKIYNFGLNINI